MNSSLIVIVLCALVASAVYGKHNKEEWQARKQKCIEETGVDSESATLKGTTSDPKAKCFRTCMMKASGYYKADGTMDLEKAIAKIPADNAEKAQLEADLKECAAKRGANECETCYETMICSHDKKIHQRIHGKRGKGQ